MRVYHNEGMREHSDKPPERLIRELKRWKMLAAVLLGLVVVLGSLSAWLMRAMATEYSRLIDRSVPALTDLREIDNSALSAHRALLAALLAENREACDLALGRLEAQLDQSRRMRDSLSRQPIFEGPEPLAALNKAGADYETAANEFLALARGGRMAEASARRNDRVKPTLDAYLAEIGAASRMVADRSQKQNADMTDTVRSRSALLVGVASLPVIIGSVALLAVIAVIVAMVVIFRRAGVEDPQ